MKIKLTKLVNLAAMVTLAAAAQPCPNDYVNACSGSVTWGVAKPVCCEQYNNGCHQQCSYLGFCDNGIPGDPAIRIYKLETGNQAPNICAPALGKCLTPEDYFNLYQ